MENWWLLEALVAEAQDLSGLSSEHSSSAPRDIGVTCTNDTASLDDDARGTGVSVRVMLVARSSALTNDECEPVTVDLASVGGGLGVGVRAVLEISGPQPPDKGRTTLAWERARQRSAMVALPLVRAAADVRATLDEMRAKLDAVHVRASETLYSVSDSLFGESAGERLFNAAGKGETTLVRQLLADSANVNWAESQTAGHDGWTPLIKAASRGHDDVLTLLIEARAPPTSSRPISSQPIPSHHTHPISGFPMLTWLSHALSRPISGASCA
jgi:hypothetical protein